MKHAPHGERAVRVGTFSARHDLWLSPAVAPPLEGATRLRSHELLRMAHALRNDAAALSATYGLLLRSRAREGAGMGMTSADMIADIERALRLGHLVGYLVVRRRAATLARPEGEHEPGPESVVRKETDFIRVRLTNGFDHPFENEPFELTLEGQKTEKGKLDGDGRLERKGVPFGRFTLEFPSLFGMTVIRDEQRIYDRGRGSPTALPPPPAPPGELDWFAGGSHDDRVDEDDDDEDEDDAQEYLPADGGAAWAEPFDGPSERDGGDAGALEMKEPVPTADLVGMTGCDYQLVVLYCVSLRLVDRDTGEWVRQPLAYKLSEAGGKQIASGESQDGIVFHDETAMGDFTLEIEGEKYPVVATPHARLYDLVHIQVRS